MAWIFLALAALAGMSLPVQAALNTRLRDQLASPMWSAVASFVGGLMAILAITLALRTPWPGTSKMSLVPWWGWLGGLCGAAFVVSTVFVMPRTGLALFVCGLVAGQMLLSVVMDHYGWLGVPIKPASTLRVAGAALVVAGVVMVQKG